MHLGSSRRQRCLQGCSLTTPVMRLLALRPGPKQAPQRLLSACFLSASPPLRRHALRMAFVHTSAQNTAQVAPSTRLKHQHCVQLM